MNSRLYTQDDSGFLDAALRACSWLGACEGPIGTNAFGPCYFRALMAYDCAANPNHRSRNKAHALWDCLQRVETCGEVDACIGTEGHDGVDQAIDLKLG